MTDTWRPQTPEEVVADCLASLPYDFPDDAKPMFDAAKVVLALRTAGYALARFSPPADARSQT